MFAILGSRMPRPMLYYDDEDEDGSQDSVGYVEEDHPLQLHGNRELAAQAVKLLQVPSRPGDASFASSTTDMDVPIYVRGGPSAKNKVRVFINFLLIYFFFFLTIDLNLLWFTRGRFECFTLYARRKQN